MVGLARLHLHGEPVPVIQRVDGPGHGPSHGSSRAGCLRAGGQVLPLRLGDDDRRGCDPRRQGEEVAGPGAGPFVLQGLEPVGVGRAGGDPAVDPAGVAQSRVAQHRFLGPPLHPAQDAVSGDAVVLRRIPFDGHTAVVGEDAQPGRVHRRLRVHARISSADSLFVHRPDAVPVRSAGQHDGVDVGFERVGVVPRSVVGRRLERYQDFPNRAVALIALDAVAVHGVIARVALPGQRHALVGHRGLYVDGGTGQSALRIGHGHKAQQEDHGCQCRKYPA